MKITLNNYQDVLSKIQNRIKDAQDVVLRERVVMSWNVGKIINEYLLENDDVVLLKELVKKLSLDLSINETVLYKMHSFFKSYPVLPDDNLNWSHYRVLSGIKDQDRRKYLQEMTIKNSWASNILELEVKKLKDADKIKDVKTNKRLVPVRGRLFTYPLINNPTNKEQKFIDCGFNVFKDVKTDIEVGTTIKSVKDADVYSFKEFTTSKRKLNIYKAHLERVVDGDTIRVILDLGFKTYHREILRLKGINAPEKKTSEGKRSTKILEAILKDTPFLVIKTIKIDIFGRYVADVYFDEGKRKGVSAQEVADEGVYLNQLLLDEGSVELI